MINPKDAQKLDDDDRAKIVQAEKKIDAMLRNRYQGTGSVNITVGFPDLNERSRRALIFKYQSGGWSIKEREHKGERGDPRDRDYTYWEFKAQSNPTCISDIK